MINSYFDNLGEVDLYRVDTCYYGSNGLEVVPCTRDDLFYTSAFIREYMYNFNITGSNQINSQIVNFYIPGFISDPIFIGIFVLLIVALILAILACCYIRCVFQLSGLNDKLTHFSVKLYKGTGREGKRLSYWATPRPLCPVPLFLLRLL